MTDVLPPAPAKKPLRPVDARKQPQPEKLKRVGPWRQRLRRVPWGKVGIGTAAFVLLVAVVPPFRNAVAAATSRVILFVASPFSPSIAGFEDLPEASRVHAADGSEIGTLGTEMREPVKLADLPPHVPKAVLAAEDANFYRHSGVDPGAVFRALFHVVAGKEQGGSTITQQLAKLNYTGAQHTFARKFKEVLYASRLENKYTKDELLERYLNQVYFGEGAYGIAEASNRFFGVAPQKLTPAQAATLAGKIQGPSRLDPYTRPDQVTKRRDQVLRAMAGHGWLDRKALADGLSSSLNVVERQPNPGALTGGKAPHFLNYVGREAAGLGDLGESAEARRQKVLTGGYDIQTTLDVKAYDAAVAAAKQTLGEPGDPTTAIVSVQPGDGAIRVLFGGLDPNLQFDPATQGRRQPGSSFKPYVYMAMLKAGINPDTTYDGTSPQTLDCNKSQWKVRNYEGESTGSISVNDALADSVNVVFAQIMAQVGPSAVADVAQTAGIDKADLTPPECAMALGGLRQGVSPLEQATAFATFAAKGEYAKPYSITKITDRDGNVVYDHGPTKTSHAFRDKEAGVLTAALEGVVKNGTGTAAAIGRPLAGKTGTTENYGNAWFIGYVPQMSTAVWVGYPDGDRPMTNVHGRSVTGGSFPAMTFSRYMKAALAGTPVQDLYRATFDELNVKPAAQSLTVPVNSAPPPTATTPTTPATAAPVTAPPTTAAPATTRPTTPPITAAPVTTRAPTPTNPSPTVPVSTTKKASGGGLTPPTNPP